MHALYKFGFYLFMKTRTKNVQKYEVRGKKIDDYIRERKREREREEQRVCAYTYVWVCILEHARVASTNQMSLYSKRLFGNRMKRTK